MKRHTPAQAQQSQIKTILDKVYDGEPVFISEADYRKWFGIVDAKARQYLFDLWHGSKNLYYITVKDGWVLVNKDKQKDWLEVLIGE